jgi:hypothetical protein
LLQWTVTISSNLPEASFVSEGQAVEVPLDIDVVVDTDAAQTPFGEDVGLDRQGLKRRPVVTPRRCSMRRLIIAAILAALALMVALPTSAQLDPGNFEISQNGRTVGEIFVPTRALCTTGYIEHWVLSADYAYPRPDSAVMTQIRAPRQRYASEDDFFARVPWGPGSRYVRIDVTESDRLPGHR